jgi:hypothetical protein
MLMADITVVPPMPCAMGIMAVRVAPGLIIGGQNDPSPMLPAPPDLSRWHPIPRIIIRVITPGLVPISEGIGYVFG